MKATVKKACSRQEFPTTERCFILEISNDADDSEVSIAQARVEPGVTTAWHQLDGVAERYLIISGMGKVEIGDTLALEVSAGDVARIPANMPQRITNTGEGDLIFFAICSPRFQKSCYTSLE